jgi:hypothetical protein
MRSFSGITPPWNETYWWDPHKAHPWLKPRRLMYNMWGPSARGWLCTCPRSHLKKLRQPYISPIWGAATPRPIIMNFGLLDGPANIINCSNFCLDRLEGFCSARCWNWPFPTLSDHCPQHSVERYRAYTWCSWLKPLLVTINVGYQHYSWTFAGIKVLESSCDSAVMVVTSTYRRDGVWRHGDSVAMNLTFPGIPTMIAIENRCLVIHNVVFKFISS